MSDVNETKPQEVNVSRAASIALDRAAAKLDELLAAPPVPQPPPRWPHSAEIDKIATALAKAQGQIKGALKDARNEHYKSSYADLYQVSEACREPLSANGIAVLQTTETLDGKPHLVTRLIHTSGQWFRSEWPLKPQQDTPQGLGSCVTYARRYSLAAMSGVAPRGDDDDGNAASAPAGKKNDPPPQKSWGDLQPANGDPPPAPSGKPQRQTTELAELVEPIVALPADVAKALRQLEPFAGKPFTEIADPELKAIGRVLDSQASKATNPKNRMVLATLASVVTAEVGKRAGTA